MVWWLKLAYLRVASEETVSEASQEARGDDGAEGVRPESHHRPGEDAGQGGGDQQPLGSEPLLEEPASHSEYDGWNILSSGSPPLCRDQLLFCHKQPAKSK